MIDLEAQARLRQQKEEAIVAICGLTGVNREQLAAYMLYSPHDLFEVLELVRQGGEVSDELCYLAVRSEHNAYTEHQRAWAEYSAMIADIRPDRAVQSNQELL